MVIGLIYQTISTLASLPNKLLYHNILAGQDNVAQTWLCLRPRYPGFVKSMLCVLCTTMNVPTILKIAIKAQRILSLSRHIPYLVQGHRLLGSHE